MKNARPAAVDAVVVKDGLVLAVKRKFAPHRGRYVLPGGFVDAHETVEEALVREVAEETGYRVRPVTLIGVYSDPKRDPRGVISIAFLAKVTGGKLTNSRETTAVWLPLTQAHSFAFDHAKIFKDALKMIRSKV